LPRTAMNLSGSSQATSPAASFVIGSPSRYSNTLLNIPGQPSLFK
jgi:hypothetical protein